MTALALPRRRPPPDPRLLQRCLLLAVLLHIWLVLMFGNTTGTAQPGQGVWGSLSVRLGGRSGAQAEAPPGAQTGGTAPAAAAPAAARADRAETRTDAPPDAADEPPPATATLPLPEGFRPVEREALNLPAARDSTPLAPATPLPAPVGRLDTPADAALAPLSPAGNLRPTERRPELPAALTAAPAAVQRLEAEPSAAVPVAELPRPVELRAPMPATALPAPASELPAAVNRLEAPAPAAAVGALPRPAELRAPASTARVADVAPAQPLPAPVQRLEAPAAAESGGVARLPAARELRRPAEGAATALPSAPDLPAPVRRLEAADGAAALTPLTGAASPRASLAPPSAAAAVNELAGSLPGEVSAPAGPARGDPQAQPLAGTTTGGRGDTGPRPGAELAAVPAPPASAAARTPLNLSLPRGDMSARRSPGLVELLPPPPERKGKLEQSLEEAANKDCRKAYGNLGLLAAVPLAVDAVRGKGCKW